MAETVAKTNVKREKNYLYFLRGSDVWKTPMKRASGPGGEGKAEKIAAGDFKREDGYLYFIDKAGNVARAPRAVGGQKRKKARRVAAKKATKAPAKGKKAPTKAGKPAAKAKASASKSAKPAAKGKTATKKPATKKPAK